jgi:glycyl-radical enzyme activating protein
VSPIEQPTAMIFDIQHFSLNDGPGIRTSIFFKGCPLRCVWCHNPESFVKEKQLYYSHTLCTRCFKCTEVCPSGALTKNEYMGHTLLKVDHSRCIACGKCEKVCCYEAVKLIGKRCTVEDVLEQIEIGRPYFNIMGDQGEQGGITLTGGEPMMYTDFIEALLMRTKDPHVCMETNGYASPDLYRKIAPEIDLFLFDYKATGKDLHQKLCGAENEQILYNLDMLYQMGAVIILRLPFIPGVNDSDTHIAAIADLMKKYPRIKRAEIMAYNNFGFSKAEAMGLADRIIHKPNADMEIKEKWLRAFEKYGTNIRIG